VLALVGLGGYEQQFSSQLSGGEQQRVALARAIVIRPRVLLFDEPLSNLDAKLRVQMRHEIRDLQRTLGITTVYVTHDQEEAMAVSDRIAVMSGGSVVQEGTAEDPLPPSRVAVRRASSWARQSGSGRSTSVAGEVAKVAALGSTVDALVVTPGLAPGTAVRLVVRPESIAITAPSDSAALSATVASRTVPWRKDRIPLALRGRDAAGRALRRRAGWTSSRKAPPVAVRFAAGAVSVLPENAGSQRSE
jgi:ABC-type Fe3+/spermidine/putrescine transport system ATPase subunit